MVNLRRPPVDVCACYFWMEVWNPRPFYFVGDGPAFTLEVQNGGFPWKGDVDVIWELLRKDRPAVHRARISFDLQPHDRTRRYLDIEWLHADGTGIYTLDFPSVKNPVDGRTYQIIHPMASYVVFDPGVYEQDRRDHAELLTLNRRTLYGFVASVVASATLAVVSLVLALRLGGL
ncbi:MAG TPA: hypothetical protein VGV89_05965 [Thermoplasmata archaeon]|nr:hypothetical protein [Thermoplasmata archaeon]